MSNYFYTIGGNIRQQEEGGSIGSDATGELTRIYMLLWDEKMIDEVRSLGLNIDLYRRYVDDMVVVARAIGLGWSFNKKKGIMEYDSNNAERDAELSDTERTAKVLAEIANSIHSQIQVTIDSPERNPDMKMPVLDLKLWINSDSGIPQLRYTFFKKPVASPYTIMKRSAISERIKKATIFQEALRRLMNTSQELEWKEKAKHLSDFSFCLRNSGYSSKERFECICGAVMRYEEMVKKVENGDIDSLNRNK